MNADIRHITYNSQYRACSVSNNHSQVIIWSKYRLVSTNIYSLEPCANL